MASILRIERVSHDLPQREVAARTGIPQPRYSRIERNVTQPTSEEAEALGACFGVNPADLWTDGEAQP
jgi:transcriptional regulator with XRE-family HTH domain